MKKYMICLFLFLGISAVCVTVGYLAKQQYEKAQSESATEMSVETETVVEDRLAANQREVIHETVAEEYYLVAEDGVLLVFLKDKKTISLYTHVPLMDFPAKERDRLREGIWFPSMMEVFNYLESYTS